MKKYILPLLLIAGINQVSYPQEVEVCDEIAGYILESEHEAVAKAIIGRSKATKDNENDWGGIGTGIFVFLLSAPDLYRLGKDRSEYLIDLLEKNCFSNKQDMEKCLTWARSKASKEWQKILEEGIACSKKMWDESSR